MLTIFSKNRRMKILLVLLFLNITLSCATRNINYNHISIIEKYSSNYIIYVDNKKIDFENVYLDKHNIEYVKINKRDKTLHIKQLKTIELIEVSKLYLNSLTEIYYNHDISQLKILIVVNGLPRKENFSIDPKTISSIKLLSKNDIHNFLYGEKSFDGGIIIETN